MKANFGSIMSKIVAKLDQCKNEKFLVFHHCFLKVYKGQKGFIDIKGCK